MYKKRKEYRNNQVIEKVKFIYKKQILTHKCKTIQLQKYNK